MEKKPVVLLVDDDDDSRKSLAGLLSTYHCSIIEKSDLNSAVEEVIGNSAINMLVTDLNLHEATDDMSGVSLGKMCKQVREDMPVAGYSQKIETNRFAIRNNQVFDLFLDSSNAKAEDFTDFAQACSRAAFRHISHAGQFVERLRPDLKIQEMNEKLSRINARIDEQEGKYVTQDKVITIVLGAFAIVITIFGLYQMIK